MGITLSAGPSSVASSSSTDEPMPTSSRDGSTSGLQQPSKSSGSGVAAASGTATSGADRWRMGARLSSVKWTFAVVVWWLFAGGA